VSVPRTLSQRLIRTFVVSRSSGITNLVGCPDGTPVVAELVIGAYHRLFALEASSHPRLRVTAAQRPPNATLPQPWGNRYRLPAA